LAIVPLALAGIVLPVDAIWHAAHALLWALMKVLEALAAWPSAIWSQHAPQPWAVVAGTVGVLLLLAPRGTPGRWLGWVWLSPMLVVTPTPPPPGGFRLTALDVGQGLAVVIETSRHAMLYDTGPRLGSTDAGSRIIAPFLRAAGIRTLDALVVSHQDLDHSGGALSLMQTVPVTTLWSSLPVDGAIVTRAATHGTVWRCMAGQAWEWDGVRFTVLFPPIERFAASGVKTNDLSCVVRIDSAYGSALLTGDIEAPSEAMLLHDLHADLRADAVVVPHHGSRTSSTPAFVKTMAPRVAIFAMGYRNRFGHPRPDVVARYKRVGATLMRSDWHGAVTLDFGPASTMTPIAERDRRRRYWYDAPGSNHEKP
jgi:competence protein ComEC